VRVAWLEPHSETKPLTAEDAIPSSHALLPKEKGISNLPSPLGRGAGVRIDAEE
jgi:hypothetical protein